MSEVQYNTLVKSRGIIKGRVTRFINFFIDNPNCDIHDVEPRRVKLEEYHKAFSSIQADIDNLILQAQEREVLESQQEVEREQFEDQYFKCARLISERIHAIQPANNVSNNVNSASTSQNVTIQHATSLLPQLKIAPYDGNPLEWKSFYNAFQSLVHNVSTIPTSQKFYLLRDLIRGELASILDRLEGSDEDYQVAWELLRKRCDKPRKIIFAHLQALFELKSVTKETPSNLRALREAAQKHVSLLKLLKEPIEHWNSILIYIIAQKLDKRTRRAWERSLADEDKPTFDELMNFISTRERGDDSEDNSFLINKSAAHKCTHQSKPIQISGGKSFVSTQRQLACNYCKASHSIYTCEAFLKLSPIERNNAAKRNNLCINCLRDNHSTFKCNASTCKRCHKRHNSLLHIEYNKVTDSSANPTASMRSNEASFEGPPPTSACAPIASTLIATVDSEVLLGTARVYILDHFKNPYECRVLLDSGSQTNFMSEEFASRLNLEGKRIDMPFAGLGEIKTRATSKVSAIMRSRVNKYEQEFEFVTLPTITGILPSRKIDKNMLNLAKELKLADPEFHKPARIDALLGATAFYKILCNGQFHPTSYSQVVCQKTLLGWVIVGEIEVASRSTLLNQTASVCHLVTNLEKQLSRFWEIEEVSVEHHSSIEEKACEKLYTETTRREKDGRYVVKLPFNKRKSEIGESYLMALRRFHSLERKLDRNQALKAEYTKFLREYTDLGHMTNISHGNQLDDGYYIPHHAVVKEQNATTKLRVVFDASAKSTTQVSLNNALLTGPTIQDDLINIILRFRMHNVVFAADLKKMYRQIKVDTGDANYQKILWRENNNDKIRIYKLVTLTQGTASAPYLATRTLHQLVIDEGDKFPLAAPILKGDFYVDDCLSGANTINEALEIKLQLIKLLALGGFELHKWISNSTALCNDSQDDNAQIISLDDKDRKLLGIHWNAKTDSINYQVNEWPSRKQVSKRIILSEIAQLFDPLGLLGPIIVSAKMLMQELWKAGLDWDESVPQHLHSQWIKFKADLPSINRMMIRRQMILSDTSDIQLHGFSDASEKAYGACVYVKSTGGAHSIVNLVCAKSRIAPIKATTLPRLELCAALLLTKLVKKVTQALQLSCPRVHYWSDSTVALHWIKSSPHSLNTYVANRVAQIQELSRKEDWHHVASEENAADVLSRGQLPSELLNNTLWWNGPAWLTRKEQDWKVLQLSKIVIPEQRAKVALVNVANQETNDTFTRFSSWSRLVKFTAFCRRAVKNRTENIKMKGPYSIHEIREARQCIIKIIQGQYFASDINCLKNQGPGTSKGALVALSPFIDDTGILRVGGRLNNANIEFSRKYPILLPRHDHVTLLIIRETHEKFWHAGVQATLNAVRCDYWIIDGKTTVKNIISKCVRCRKMNPIKPKYTMGNLPSSRVTQARPFSTIGLDYCGPFMIKEKKFRNKQKVKSYVCVFVCFVTRAVHVELVTDLTTETCLEALKRFVARRGKPDHIYSDNATNFVGAKNELKEIKKFLLAQSSSISISNYMQNEGVEWHCIPPRSPHFGGLWEAAVKSLKRHLYRTLGQALLTYEQFNTCIVEIEAILNSRPLTPLSSDPNDFIALTPSHFLIGDVSKGLPSYDYRELPINRQSAWQRVQSIKQHFWTRWQKEYLNELRTRSKWHLGNAESIKVGTLVTIQEENAAPMHWSLGRIIEVHPGTDSIARVATVKTQHGIFKRCVKKLSPLPIDSQDEK